MNKSEDGAYLAIHLARALWTISKAGTDYDRRQKSAKARMVSLALDRQHGIAKMIRVYRTEGRKCVDRQLEELGRHPEAS
jgi:hypothetical protein